jgi:ribonuclease R
MNARGFGFVVTEGDAPDVFVRPDRLGGALHGDRVQVEAVEGPRGLDGRIVEVIERGLRHIGGQLHIASDGAWIEPDDERLPVSVRVQGGLPADARTGLGVLAEVTGYPEALGKPLLVRVLETYEPSDFARFELRRILLRESIQEEFPDAVTREAAQLPSAVTRAEKAEREDLRNLPLVTIDPADARDHDDALYAEPRPGGGWRVIVAIADVSHYVREGSAIDEEAIARGCTIYLPSHAIPMLPPELSTHLASLVPDRDRLALAVEVNLSANGTVRSHRFIEALMRSHARLSYEGVAAALGLTDGPSQAAAQAHLPSLRVLLEVADVLRVRRKRRGALMLDLPEAKVTLKPSGLPRSIERARRDPGIARTYALVEELMLLANEVVATELYTQRIPAIYRVHGPPDPDRMESFASLARALGHDVSKDGVVDPKKLSRLLEKVEGTPQAASIGYLLLRAMQQASYSTVNIGHFGLAADHYVHFTSPIRRYPDLAVHRIVRELARGRHPRSEGLVRALEAQANASSMNERRALNIEREVVSLYGALLMRDRIGEELDAVITGVSEHGCYASLGSPFVDVLCPVGSLPYDRYELGRHGVRLVGRYSGRAYALGDSMRVRIEDVSMARRKVIAVPIESGAKPERTGKRKRAERKAREPRQNRRLGSKQRPSPRSRRRWK